LAVTKEFRDTSEPEPVNTGRVPALARFDGALAFGKVLAELPKVSWVHPLGSDADGMAKYS
jgi:hypothetical protein